MGKVGGLPREGLQRHVVKDLKDRKGNGLVKSTTRHLGQREGKNRP